MDWGVTPTDLIKGQGLDYEEYDLSDKTFLQNISSGIIAIAKKIKAALIVSERIILIDENLHDAKKPFGQAHELGHECIPEHKEIFYVCSEIDLAHSVRKEMEFEANIFASELIFPSHLLEAVHTNFPLSMSTILYLKAISGGSFHSAALKYVESSPNECCLLILDLKTDENGNKGLYLNGKQICSPSWWSKNKRLLADPQFFPSSHNLSQIVYSFTMEDFIENELVLNSSPKLRLKVHSFYNQYNAFALLFK